MNFKNFQPIQNRQALIGAPTASWVPSVLSATNDRDSLPTGIRPQAQRLAEMPDRNSLATAIRSGIQLDSRDLECVPVAYRYRGIPVFLFGLEQISNSFGQVHIYPKCSVVNNYQGPVWISSDYKAARKAFPQDQLKPCPHCLRHLYSHNIPDVVHKDRFGNVTDIDWITYTRYFASNIFKRHSLVWKNGERPQKVSSVFTPENPKYNCSICQCDIKTSGWALNQELAERSGLPKEICLLCAERRARAIILAPPQASLRAATLRYESLAKQLGSEPQASWIIAEQVVPASWLPLIQKLKSLMGPPKVFQVIAPRVLAVLCWPNLGRAIIADGTKEARIPASYSVWRKAQIERELGLSN
ncbi:hypothetical protein BTJ40_08715 [Microbulbifer sp. A4B17]|uniref:hypothetical protein n=1 Tax=Microbulbifer sp. A4B17 TaxID=359370 RepID=UPI000D52C2ED|nr:hypothetical protein [Microbulbifer sp. A4B17]AWF80880.1 hypothetical protein BTJ40_08715 [Microbulbifer sp. A4B17]